GGWGRFLVLRLPRAARRAAGSRTQPGRNADVGLRAVRQPAADLAMGRHVPVRRPHRPGEGLWHAEALIALVTSGLAAGALAKARDAQTLPRIARDISRSNCGRRIPSDGHGRAVYRESRSRWAP